MKQEVRVLVLVLAFLTLVAFGKISDSNLRRLFNHIDTNADGSISSQELRE